MIRVSTVFTHFIKHLLSINYILIMKQDYSPNGFIQILKLLIIIPID